MSSGIQGCVWPVSRAGEALTALARRSGLVAVDAAGVTSPPPGTATDSGALVAWADAAAAALGLEVEPVTIQHDEAARFAFAGPALVRVAGPDGPGLLALLRAPPGRRPRALAPDLSEPRLAPDDVRHLLCSAAEAPLEREVGALLDACGVSPARREAARAALLSQRLATRPVADGWLVRTRPGASFTQELAAAGLTRLLGGVAGLFALEHVLWMLSWWVIGRGALEGRLEPAWLVAWALLLFSVIPLKLLGAWWQGRFALGAGGLLKRRLLAGALRLKPEEVRHEGASGLLGRVIESDAVESLALSGGFLALAALVELVLSAVVLGVGAGGTLHGLLLLAWAGGTAWLAVIVARRRRRWTRHRLDLTTDLVESMVGHRTRQAQEAAGSRHDAEDSALARYFELSVAMDRATAWLSAVAPRGWLVVGLAALAPVLATGLAGSGRVAIALGGVLLGWRSLRRLAQGASHLAGASIAWERVASLFAAAARLEREPPPDVAAELARPSSAASTSLPVVEVAGLTFRHEGRPTPVFSDLSVAIATGDRLLLEGPSGAGKSTLAALLCGLREPTSGLLLHRGLDARTLGARGWRRRVVAAPQFHENHVFTETLAFNLLMGGRWPATAAQFQQAEATCRELGLGPLLDRMPSGLLQLVGEGGWQLSHGERSRVFIARALLQGAELVVLDESFGALDPESLAKAMACVLRRSPTTLVIAHP